MAEDEELLRRDQRGRLTALHLLRPEEGARAGQDQAEDEAEAGGNAT